MPTTFKVFNLGVQTEIDTVESNWTSDNHDDLNGLVVGSAGDPLALQVQEFSGVSWSGGEFSGYYDADSDGVNETFSINGGPAQTFDAATVYANTIITYTDGTTATVSALVTQDADGNCYLIPPAGVSSYGDALEAKPIQSILLGTAMPANGDEGSGAQLEATGSTSAAGAALNYVVEGTAAGEVINAGYGGDPQGDRIDNNDHIDGSNDDSVQAGGGDDTIDSALGDDTVDAGDGNDIVYAEAGDDDVMGGQGDDTLNGGSGSDTLSGGTGADSLEGGDGEDLLVGGSGNDTLWGREDNDTLIGGDGDDFLNGGYGDDLVQGGDGDDFLEGWYGNDTIEGGAGHDFIDADIDSDLVYGGDGDDTVLGGYSVSTDTIFGGAGNDSLDGQSGDDLLYGGTGDDVLIGNFGDDTIFLEDNFGNDTIIGTEGDEINGDTLDLSAVTTDTTINLSDGNPERGTVSNGTDMASFVDIENIILGSGRDTIILADGSGVDVVHAFDMTDSGDGTTNDQLDVTGLTSDGGTTPVTTADVIVTDTNGDGTGDAILTFPYAESITLVGVLPSAVDTPAKLEAIGVPGSTPDGIVDGSSGNDAMPVGYVDQQGDVIDGADGLHDTVFGYGGDDTIDGGLGNDSIDGGTGNDIITAGAGDDTVTGGAGDDVFIYGTGHSNDTITDFNAGNSGTLNDGDATNNDFVDLSGHYDHLSELYADQADDGILNQSNAFDTRGNATDYSDNSGFGTGSLTLAGATADNSSLTVENTGVVCFTAGTAIGTPRGDVLIEDLKMGDYVTTVDNGPQQIRWIGRRHVDDASFRSSPSLRPVLIKRGVLGAKRDLFVSRQHGMLVGRDHLVRAAHLATTLPGVRIAHGLQNVTYVHLLFDEHQIIFAENTKSESFFPGRVALQMMDTGTRDELFTLFPELADIDPSAFSAHPYGKTARDILNRKALELGRGSARRSLARIIGK